MDCLKLALVLNNDHDHRFTSRNKVQNLLTRRIYFYTVKKFEWPLYCYSKFLNLFQLGLEVEISGEAYMHACKSFFVVDKT